MGKRKIPKPTDSELEVLKILWSEGASTVKTVNEKLSKRKPVGYTTTLKIMQIMYEKGLLRREKDGRGHLYEPVLDQDKTREMLMDKILQAAFGGSAAKLVIQALNSRGTTESELDQIKEFINKMENKKK